VGVEWTLARIARHCLDLRFQKASAWLPERDRAVALELVDAAFAKRVQLGDGFGELPEER